MYHNYPENTPKQKIFKECGDNIHFFNMTKPMDEEEAKKFLDQKITFKKGDCVAVKYYNYS